jgi:hypothetical protein
MDTRGSHKPVTSTYDGSSKDAIIIPARPD